jgi:hypothetical protein
MPTLNENLAAGIAALSSAQQVFVAEKAAIDAKKTELEASVNLKKDELTSAVNTAIASTSNSPFGGLVKHKTAGGQDSWFFGISKKTWTELRPDNALGSGTHEAFIEAGIEREMLWIGAFPACVVNGEVVCQPNVFPSTGYTQDEEIALCSNTTIIGFEGKHRAMSNWDWSLLLHLAIATGYQPSGNTQYGKYHANPLISGHGTTVTKTGSMGQSSYHNNTFTGISGLVGDVWERPGIIGGMYLQDGQIYLAADNGSAPVATGYYFTGSSETAQGTPSIVSSAGDVVRNGEGFYDVIGGANGFASLTGSGSVALKRAGIIPVSSTTAPNGAIWVKNSDRRAPLRGGGWHDGAFSGLGALSLYAAPSYRYSDIGFRPAFVA